MMGVFSKDIEIALAFATPIAVALAFHPLFQMERRRRTAALIAVVLAIAPLALLVPKDMPATRFFAALAAVWAAAKMFDVHQQREAPPSFARWAAYVVHPFSAVLRRLDAEPLYPPSVNLKRTAAGAACSAVGFAAMSQVFHADVSKWPFAAEHTAKILTFYTGLYGLLAALVSMVRLFRVKARDIFDNPFIAVTPADFWRRYNRVVGQSLHENVFKRVGGLRHPVRATLLTFLASGVMHEYLSVITLEKFQGYQLMFFMVQGLGVLVTLRLRPTGLRALACIAMTLVFNISTGMIFIATVDQIIPWWSRPPFPYW